MPPSPAAARAGIVAAVKAGRLKRSRLEQAAARQIALLLHYAGTAEQAQGGAPGCRPRGLARSQCGGDDRGGRQVQRPARGRLGDARRRPGRGGQLLGRGPGGRPDGAGAPGRAGVAGRRRAGAEAQEEGEPQGVRQAARRPGRSGSGDASPRWTGSWPPRTPARPRHQHRLLRLPGRRLRRRDRGRDQHALRPGHACRRRCGSRRTATHPVRCRRWSTCCSARRRRRARCRCRSRASSATAARTARRAGRVPAPATRVSTSVAALSPRRSRRLRSCSGTISTPRFLIVSEPMLRSRSAALSGFSR